MAKVRITIIGGGSYMWGPIIMRDLILKEDLSGSEVILHDLDPEPLDLMQRLGQRIIEKAGANFRIKATTDLREALRGTDYVILTISTGGLEAMRHDLEIPLKYGIYQSVGDTVGPGGISRALRNVPVVVEICRKMEELCPQAWMINYSNPMTTLCRAMNRATKIKVIGLCHELFGVLRTLKKIFKLEREEEIQVKAAGINHLTWILDLIIKGKEGFPLLRKYIESRNLREDLSKIDFSRMSPFQDNNLVKFELFQVFGCLPAAGDRHVAEFFPYFLTEETEAGKKYGVKLTHIEHRLEQKKVAKKRAEEMLDHPERMEMKPSREAVSHIISTMANQKEEIHIMNLPNQGQIANLPREVVVETLGVVNASGAQGISIGDLPHGVLNSLYHHVLNQELTVEAALTGNKKLVLQALLNDPLVRNLGKAKKMLDELLEANADYLPQF